MTNVVDEVTQEWTAEETEEFTQRVERDRLRRLAIEKQEARLARYVNGLSKNLRDRLAKHL